MSDFLANLVGRALGIAPVVQPRVTSIFAATPAPGSNLRGADLLSSANPDSGGDAAQMQGIEEWGGVQPHPTSTPETAIYPAETDNPAAHSPSLSQRQAEREEEAFAARPSELAHSAAPDTWPPAQIDAQRRGQALDASQGHRRVPHTTSQQTFDDPARQGEGAAQQLVEPNHGLHVTARQRLPTTAEGSQTADQANSESQLASSPQVRRSDAGQHEPRLHTQPQAPFSTLGDDPSPPAQRLRLPAPPSYPTSQIADGEARLVEGTLPAHRLLVPPAPTEQPTMTSTVEPTAPTAALPVRLLPEQSRPATPQPLYGQAEQGSHPPLSRPAIHISIGRIDVRAVQPPAPPRQPAVAAAPIAPVLSLNDYLQSFKRSER